MTFKKQSKWALVLNFIPVILIITIFIWLLLDHLKNFEMIGRFQKQTASRVKKSFCATTEFDKNPTYVNFSKPNSSLYRIEASSVDITASKSVDSAETFYSKFCSLNSVWWYSNILTTSDNTVCLLTAINQFWRIPLENTYWGIPEEWKGTQSPRCLLLERRPGHCFVYETESSCRSASKTWTQNLCL